MQKVTAVPKTPDFVRGVINLRGKVIPVIELSKKFSMKSNEDTDKTCIIVVQIGGSGNELTLGVIIDEVSEVLDIKAENIQETPSFGGNVNTDFILGMGKIGNNVKMLLDIDKALTVSDMKAVTEIAKS